MTRRSYELPSPGPPDRRLLSFLTPCFEPGFGADPTLEPEPTGKSVDCGDDANGQSEPTVVFEAFIPPNTRYRTPFPIPHEELMEIIESTPGACFRFVLEPDPRQSQAGGRG